MATNSSTLAWKIPWTEEPGGLQSMGLLRVRLSDFTFTFPFHALEEEMATHSSPLAWKIPWIEEPGGLQSTGSLRVGQRGGAVKALSPKARPFCDRQVVPTEGGLRGSLLHAVPVP